MLVIGFFLCSLKLEQERVAEKHDMIGLGSEVSEEGRKHVRPNFGFPF
jgi:hypothetical protein